MKNIIELKIDKIIYNGYSIGKYKGIIIFTRWGVPGDTVKVEITEKKKNYYKGRILNLIGGSKNRIEAKCPYFEKCGGCQMQNIKYEVQLKIKENFLKEALNRYSNTKNISVKPIVGANKHFGYRNKAQLPVKNGHIGFYSINSHSIVDLKEGCVIQDSLIDENIKILNKIPREEKVLEYVSHIILRKDSEGIYPIFVTDRPVSDFPIVKNLKNITGLFESVKTVAGNRIMGDEFIHKNGEKFLKINYFGENFVIYPWSFLQVNDEMAEILYKKAMDYLDLDNQSVVLDGYSGVGILSMLIAKTAKRVFSVEYESSSVVSLGMNVLDKGIKNIKIFQGDIEKILEKNKQIKFNRAVIDPPQKGVSERTINEIIKRNPKIIVYISCNPQTLVRDISKFMSYGNYNCDYIQSVDLFPQTFHVENIAILRH